MPYSYNKHVINGNDVIRYMKDEIANPLKHSKKKNKTEKEKIEERILEERKEVPRGQSRRNVIDFV